MYAPRPTLEHIVGKSPWVWTRTWPQRLTISLGVTRSWPQRLTISLGVDQDLASETDNLSGCGPGPGLRD